VRISCDEHYELTQEGEAMPRCLSTGEWEVGKTCAPIMCDAYIPPEHGSVFPDTAVMAGQTVSMHCLHVMPTSTRRDCHMHTIAHKRMGRGTAAAVVNAHICMALMPFNGPKHVSIFRSGPKRVSMISKWPKTCFDDFEVAQNVFQLFRSIACKYSLMMRVALVIKSGLQLLTYHMYVTCHACYRM
jgi:hypothetical protein